MYEKENVVKNHARMGLLLKERSARLYAANFAVKGVSWKNASAAEIIFTRQMVAVAKYDNLKFGLGRVLALILVDGVMELASNSSLATGIIEEIFETSSWGSALVEECRADDTPAMRFAKSCKGIERGWGDPDKIEESSEPELSDEQSEFLANISKLNVEQRSGWLKWNVPDAQADTIAEHTVAAQLMAITMKFVYGYGDPGSGQDGVDIERAIAQIALHDLPAAEIGDVPVSKDRSGNSWEAKLVAFKTLVKGLPGECVLEAFFIELGKRKNMTPKFATSAGHLETDFSAKDIGEKGCVDLTDQKNNDAMENETIKMLLDSGCSWPEMWIRYSQLKFGYDQHFMDVSDCLATTELWK